jgi:hypothetical protein
MFSIIFLQAICVRLLSIEKWYQFAKLYLYHCQKHVDKF